MADADADPFWWITPLPEGEAPRSPSPSDAEEKKRLEPPTNGQRLALILYCIFKSTPPFAILLDDIDHMNRHHPFEGYQCFRCVLKELFLACWKARDDNEMIDLFAEICAAWDFEEGTFDGLVPYLLAAFESWIIDNDSSDCLQQFHKLFRFDTHLKVLYHIRAVIPDLTSPVAYICSDGGWMQVDMRKRTGQTAVPPATTENPTAFASSDVMAYVFYSRV